LASGGGVGLVGFWTKEWREEHVSEVGWMIVPEFKGRGIATAVDRAGDRARQARRHASLHARVLERREGAVERDPCKLGFELLEACELEPRRPRRRG
jgi:hypothetical protein